MQGHARIFTKALVLLSLALEAEIILSSPMGEVSYFREAGHKWDAAAEDAVPLENSGMARVRRLRGAKVTIRAGRKEDNPSGDTQQELEPDASTRQCLNGLVDASVEQSEKQITNIAFVKTHKTASTTLAAILYRYSLRHKVELAWFPGHGSAISLEDAVAMTQKSGKRFDIMHYHISIFGSYSSSWNIARQQYEQIMRDPPNIHYVTVLREPRSHFLSYYYFFLEPDTKQTIEHFLMHPEHGYDEAHKRLQNPLSAEFGIRNVSALNEMAEKHLDSFKLVILLDRFDEGLMVLRRMLKWDLIDMTYVPILKTMEGEHRWDGKPLVNVPHFSELKPQVQDQIDAMTLLDQELYNVAVERYEKKLNWMSAKVKEDLEEFQKLQTSVTTYLESNTSSCADAIYRLVNPYAKNPPCYPF